LEDTTITYNGKTVEIPGFSYVECFRGQSILISSYGWSESLYEELDGDAVAVAEMDNGIKVDLVSDIYYSPNGTKHLLFTTPDVFEQVR
jgi:hypothetical protein